MSEIKNKKLQEKLDKYKERLEKVQEFVDKVPVCADFIIKHEIVESVHNKICEQYKNLYFGWGVHRITYDETKKITNYKGDDYIGMTLNHVYINHLSLYNRHNDYNIEKYVKTYHFFDVLNTTFYCTDEQLPAMLEELHTWYQQARKKAAADFKEEKKRKLEKELEKLS